jgi:hypothetical protein
MDAGIAEYDHPAVMGIGQSHANASPFDSRLH